MAWQPDYCTLADFKSFLRIDDTVDDQFLALFISASSREIDVETNRQFGKVDAGETRLYTGEYDRRRGRWVVEFDDLHTAPAGLTITATAGAVDQYQLHPVNALRESKPFTRLVVKPESTAKPNGDEAEVSMTTDKWGWSAVPAVVTVAQLLQGSRVNWRRFTPAGVAGSPDAGSEIRLLAKLDPDVKLMLRRVVRWWGAA